MHAGRRYQAESQGEALPPPADAGGDDIKPMPRLRRFRDC